MGRGDGGQGRVKDGNVAGEARSGEGGEQGDEVDEVDEGLDEGVDEGEGGG